MYQILTFVSKWINNQFQPVSILNIHIHEKNSFLNIALLTKEANEHEDYLTIICSNEKVLLKVFGYINSLLQPDFIMEFNGSEFDWINIYEKCLYYKIIENLCENLSIKKLSNYELKKS